MTAGFPTHIRRFGKGPLPLFAFHCTLGHAGSWRGVGQVLSEVATLTSFDLPGHGKSGDWDGTTDIADLSLQMAVPLLEEPAHIVGHSFGAVLALILGVQRPDVVLSLTLFEPVLFAAARAHSPEVFDAHMRQIAPYLRALAERDRFLAARLFNRLWGDGRRWDEFPEHVRRYMADRMHMIEAQSPILFQDRAGLLSPGRLGHVQVPVLLLEGDRSPAVVAAINAALAARLPSAQRDRIEGVGHMGPITHPEAVAQSLVSFLEVAEEQVDVLGRDRPVADQSCRE